MIEERNRQHSRVMPVVRYKPSFSAHWEERTYLRNTTESIRPARTHIHAWLYLRCCNTYPPRTQSDPSIAQLYLAREDWGRVEGVLIASTLHSTHAAGTCYETGAASCDSREGAGLVGRVFCFSVAGMTMARRRWMRVRSMVGGFVKWRLGD